MNLSSVLFKNLVIDIIVIYPTICPTTYSLGIPVKNKSKKSHSSLSRPHTQTNLLLHNLKCSFKFFPDHF